VAEMLVVARDQVVPVHAPPLGDPPVVPRRIAVLTDSAGMDMAARAFPATYRTCC
jgi:hypothetical protein